MASEELRAIELLGRVPYGRLATSRRALPILAVARHVVTEDQVLLRLHRGLGHHESCDGTVIAYGADNFNTAADRGDDPWSVQFTGPAEIAHPCPEQQELFGPAPLTANGEPFDPVYLRLEPHFVTLHTLGFHATQRTGHTE
ncbi:pyridoxamine 5'-phosphate oxidase family protein [Streptomyces fulvorobeus]|uniref:Pyridoxamine 5'-phosphate oxidase n=1 Tax=Streptomyces fulvorobeus TaxID=284028 RepID=A0A7J0C6L8_9ACTN|nr:pyridoxamine 5'-phosphate oxidase family protein [Streptomyces fulvorobeus]NYE41770.1 hypothetical protein [Streptomyces fulvorobeus]GFM98141.1 hypothetical protein Sfulv_29520 [Streptomyces fulvorobeus]